MIELSRHEIATVLTALKSWKQRMGEVEGTDSDLWVAAGRIQTAMTAPEIDSLAKRIVDAHQPS